MDLCGGMSRFTLTLYHIERATIVKFLLKAGSLVTVGKAQEIRFNGWPWKWGR